MDLHRLFRSAFWHECSPLTERFPIIETLAEDFIQNSIATEKHLEHILKRESVSSFVTRPGIAFLHTTFPAKETKLAFMTLENRIVWNGHKIRAIVMAVFREEDLNLLFHLKYIFHCMKYDAELLKTKKTAKELSDSFWSFPDVLLLETDRVPPAGSSPAFFPFSGIRVILFSRPGTAHVKSVSPGEASRFPDSLISRYGVAVPYTVPVYFCTLRVLSCLRHAYTSAGCGIIILCPRFMISRFQLPRRRFTHAL